MKLSSIFMYSSFIFISCYTVPLSSATRTPSEPTRSSTTSTVATQITAMRTEQDVIDQVIFLNFINILGNFGKIVLNPDNIPAAVQVHATRVIHSMNNISQAMMGKPISEETKNLLIGAILRYSSKLSKAQRKMVVDNSVSLT